MFNQQIPPPNIVVNIDVSLELTFLERVKVTLFKDNLA
jgi:hypothetical protein